VGFDENGKPGIDGATTWNAVVVSGCAGLVRRGRILLTSLKCPGHPWMKIRGIAFG
jgi:hypothetical protein